jgi:predicted adenylyl cyclase CyaB
MAERLDSANIEIKSVCPDFDLMRIRLSRIGARKVDTIVQRDVYYDVGENMRKKMRVITDGHTELITYKRPNEKDARQSSYHVHRVISPVICHLHHKLRYGVKVVVDKKRELWMWKTVRIHLDYITSLGKFLELESMVKEGTSEEEARRLCDEMVEALKLGSENYLAESYSDLLLRKLQNKESR